MKMTESELNAVQALLSDMGAFQIQKMLAPHIKDLHFVVKDGRLIVTMGDERQDVVTIELGDRYA